MTPGLSFKRHINVMAGTLFGTKTASLTKIQVKFVQSRFLGDFYGIVRAVHVTIAAMETETAAETAL